MTIRLKDDPAFQVPEPETLFSQLVELSRQPGGMKYDFAYVLPHRYFRLLEGLGLVKVVRDNGSPRWRRARLTARGQEYIGNVQMRRRRRRRAA